MKWLCYSSRFTANEHQANPNGYIELNHPNGDANARLIFDYINGKLYYTPTHYSPTRSKNEDNEDVFTTYVLENTIPRYQCRVAGACNSPYFEIILTSDDRCKLSSAKLFDS